MQKMVPVKPKIATQAEIAEVEYLGSLSWNEFHSRVTALTGVKTNTLTTKEMIVGLVVKAFVRWGLEPKTAAYGVAHIDIPNLPEPELAVYRKMALQENRDWGDDEKNCHEANRHEPVSERSN